MLTIAALDREIIQLRRQASSVLLTPTAVGELLGVSGHSVRQWIERGRLASVTLPTGETRLTMESVSALITTCAASSSVSSLKAC
jgi:hypothetical protein